MEEHIKPIKYISDDLAPIGCDDCKGCSECCTGMGDSIVQDPYDLWNFCSHMRVAGGEQVTFDLLISEDGPWELSKQGACLLPSLKMVEPGVCSFLNANGRCSIHAIRSGLCRLYPLGRAYEMAEERISLSYFVLDGGLGCHKLSGEEGSPVKISDWLGIEDIEKYEAFCTDWYSVKKDMERLSTQLNEEGFTRLQDILLELFYGKGYSADFYEDFGHRLAIWRKSINAEKV